MANMKDYFYRQIVAEDELDGGFTELEVADQNANKDHGLAKDETRLAEFGGITKGFGVTNPSALNMTIAAGNGYDSNGNRVNTATNYTVDCSSTGVTPEGQGGTPTGGSTVDPGVGNEQWVSIFIVFDRKLSDPRLDGNGVTVYFRRDESFHFHVTAGAAGLIGSDPVRPGLEIGELLICDALVRNVASVLSIFTFDTARQELWFRSSSGTVGSPDSVACGTPRDGIEDLLTLHNSHLSGGVGSQHDSADVLHNPNTPADIKNWADGTPGNAGAAGPGVTVNSALDGVIDDLAATTSVSGVKRVGGEGQAGALANSGAIATAAQSLSPNTLFAQLKELLDAVNARVLRGGDSGIGGVLAPASDGTALGVTGTNRWDAILRNLTLEGTLQSDCIPVDAAKNLGSASLAFLKMFLQVLYASSTDGGIKYLDLKSNNTPNPESVFRFMFQSGATPIYGAMLGNPKGVGGTLVNNDFIILQLGDNPADNVFIKFVKTAVGPHTFQIIFGTNDTPIFYMAFDGGSGVYFRRATGYTHYSWIDLQTIKPPNVAYSAGAAQPWGYLDVGWGADPTTNEPRFLSTIADDHLYLCTADWPEYMTLDNIQVDWESEGQGSGGSQNLRLYAARQIWPSVSGNNRTAQALSSIANFVAFNTPMGTLPDSSSTGRRFDSFVCNQNNDNWRHASHKLHMTFVTPDGDPLTSGWAVYGVRLQWTNYTVGKWDINP